MLDGYYFHDAFFISPIISIQGNYNIKNVFLLWKALNKQEPTIDNVCFDGETCVIYLTQHLKPRIFPWISINIPVIVTLYFRETDLDSGLWKIYLHEETWTIEGMIQSVPLLGYWYNNIVKHLSGKLMVYSGKMLHSANETALILNTRNQEIEYETRKLAQENAIIRSLSTSSSTGTSYLNDNGKDELFITPTSSSSLLNTNNSHNDYKIPNTIL
ncbi:hypothetical protein BJ944DRAFT_261621 [Cunninghamella echinulata]|nr:hypothetical protein BJ944DRAFT_261621 [Cunninghamella echinulata]